MPLKDKYVVEKRHITNRSNRSRRSMSADYAAGHETANNNANADAHVRYFQNNNVQASYHQLCDSVRIVEIIPLNEQAMHIRRDMDRQTLGLGRANDRAVGISICRTGSFAEAYDRFVWATAKACVDRGWDPRKEITAHSFEDPSRRSDPQSWLTPNGVSWSQFINDVARYVRDWEKDTDEPTKAEEKRPSVSTGRENMLQNGDRGDAVEELQKRLEAAGFPLPRWGADGSFGDETEKALRDFQTAAGIQVDGIFGPQSNDALNEWRQGTRSLKRGDRGNSVRDLQRLLNQVGFNLSDDGIFGPKTEDAVKEFQSTYGISSPSGNFFGVAGPATMAELKEVAKGVPFSGRSLKLQSPMMRGEDVKRVQLRLQISADGIFGPQTDRAVKSYQREHGLSSPQGNFYGVVGPATWDHMF